MYRIAKNKKGERTTGERGTHADEKEKKRKKEQERKD